MERFVGQTAAEMVRHYHSKSARQHFDQISIVKGPGGIAVHQYYHLTLTFVQIMEAAAGKFKIMGSEIVFEKQAQLPLGKKY